MYVEVQWVALQWTELPWSSIELYVVILIHTSLCTTFQICMQCLTDLPIFPCCSRVDIHEPALCLTITYLLAVSQVRLHSIQNSTTMSDSKSVFSSSLEVMMSSNNECVFTHDMSNLTFQSILHAWGASINVDSKSPFALNYSWNAPSWWWYLHCGIEETTLPGISFIICH